MATHTFVITIEDPSDSGSIAIESRVVRLLGAVDYQVQSFLLRDRLIGREYSEATLEHLRVRDRERAQE